MPENGNDKAVSDARDVARDAGLHYVSDAMPGIKRVRRGAGFRYVMPEGAQVRDPADLARIRALAIPPAWTDVWISVTPRGHIQAIGRDARHRKQYRYHARWREVRDETKYGQLVEFGRALPAIRRRVQRDMARPGLPREKVLALVVSLLESTGIRIGNEEYARTNQSFGLTTLREKHVEVSGHTIRFKFRGKSGKQHDVSVTDRRVARMVKACQDIPGQELFQYLDEAGAPQSVESSDVNAYLREVSGEEFTAKLFRTWAGTVSALTALRSREPAESATGAKRTLVEVVKEVAARLGNTPAVCRKCYIHPAVLTDYEAVTLHKRLESLSPRGPAGLDADERLTLAYLAAINRRRSKTTTGGTVGSTTPAARRAKRSAAG